MKDNLEPQTFFFDSSLPGSTIEDAQGEFPVPQLRSVEIVDSYEFLVNGELLSVNEDFDDGELFDASMTYTDGDNSVKLVGDAPAEIVLKFGDDGSQQYKDLVASGAFLDFTSERIFGDKTPVYAGVAAVIDVCR